jgi:hypothetical protein
MMIHGIIVGAMAREPDIWISMAVYSSCYGQLTAITRKLGGESSGIYRTIDSNAFLFSVSYVLSPVYALVSAWEFVCGRERGLRSKR